jgi:hypothetical protein
MNQQHNRCELSAPIPRVTAEAVENSGPDSRDGSVKLMRVHFERNYELPLHIETIDLCRRFL